MRLRSLSDEQIEILHHASLEILERTGAYFHAAEAIDLFRQAGATVSDDRRVRIRPQLIEWALKCAPNNVTIFNRFGQMAMSLGGYRSYFGVGSDAQYIYDLSAGQRRKAVLEDVIDGTRLVDALPNLDFVMSQFLPSDVPLEKYERAQMATMLQETTKPIVFVGLEKASTAYAIEMASAVVGGLAELSKRPFVVNYVNFSSPLNHNEESIGRLLYASERNIPSVYTPGRARGSETPMTEPGAMALVNAGQLAGLVLAQLKREGSPFIWANPCGGALDMRSMVSIYAAPDSGPRSWDLAHYYGLPIFGFAGACDAKLFDAQASAEATLTLFENAINGANLVHDIGLLDSAMTGSLELVAFCDEIVGWLRHYLRPLEIDESTLPLDLIHEVGPEGSYLGTEHTVQHLREAWMPGLFDRWDYAHWSEEGALTLQERANREVKELIRDHRAERLSHHALEVIQRVVEA